MSRHIKVKYESFKQLQKRNDLLLKAAWFSDCVLKAEHTDQVTLTQVDHLMSSGFRLDLHLHQKLSILQTALEPIRVLT